MYEWVYLSKRFHFARRDKYEKDLKESWIDTHTEGNFENEREESIIDATIGEGDPMSLELGIHGPDSLAIEGQELQQEGGGTDQEVDDVDDGGASETSYPQPWLFSQDRSLGSRLTVDNVSNVMGNLLRRGKMDTLETWGYLWSGSC